MVDLSAIAALAGLPEPAGWQKRLLEEMLASRTKGTPPMRVTWSRTQRSGKMIATRYAIWAQLASEGHAHFLARDGLWCGTGDMRQLATLGPLWERLR